MAPMDWEVCLSKTGLKVVPPFTDFHTPPLAAPMYTGGRPSSLTADNAETRPLIPAEPMLRAPRPEMVSESNLASCARVGRAPARDINNRTAKNRTARAMSLVFEKQITGHLPDCRWQVGRAAKQAWKRGYPREGY